MEYVLRVKVYQVTPEEFARIPFSVIIRDLQIMAIEERVKEAGENKAGPTGGSKRSTGFGEKRGD